MDIKIHLLFFLGLFLYCNSIILAQDNNQSRHVLEGRIMDGTTKEAIPFAIIYIQDSEKGTVANTDGRFFISGIDKNELKVIFSCMGYASQTSIIKEEQKYIDVFLSPQSIELKEFLVTAKYSGNLGSDAQINNEALEYIQPTSINDIFLLLPGGVVGSNNMHGRSLISSRQAGVDESTSFGMGVSLDGIPMHNDGNRIQMSGYTGRTSVDPNKNIAINTGVDLRTISADHIESVTVTKGIASAKEGNLSSGAIKVSSKKGKTPFRIRTKLDPLNKLLYAGKGFLLSEKLGTLHTGIDITKSTDDLRNTKSAYNRITSQANYNNQFRLFRKKIDFNLKGSFVNSFNNTKDDEQIASLGEYYKTTYERYTISSKILASLDYSIIDELEFLVSADYTKDIMTHEKNVRNISVMCIQNSMEEGESEGEYLPQSYFTKYKIENKPLNYFASINGTKHGQIADNLNYSVLLGSSVSYSKNFGRGAIVNPLKPPFPNNSFIRGRPNNEIPALINNASYIETKLRYKYKKSEFNSSIGLRGTYMFNLPENYALNKLLLLEPRIQLSYILRNKINNQTLSNTLRLGYGIENKLPSLDYLYPDKIYQDYIVLNAYFTDPKKRLLITNTQIHNPVNSNIKENKNKKIELGWDIKYNKYNLSLSAFREEMNGGIEYFSEYYPISFTYYNELKHPVESKPSKDDYESYLKKDFTVNSSPNNSSKVIKKGIEYRVSIPNIDFIKSDIEINGAYYHTLYTSGVPVMYRPSITENNKAYPFVGIYKGFEKTYMERFNTNVWIHTHLPKLKLIFTNFIQFSWMQTSQLGKDVDAYPSSYLDLDGKVTSVNPSEIDNNSKLRTLKRTFPAAKYNKEEKPISVLMNLKLTKEFSRSVRLSFFVNNILQISPTYKSKQLTTQRDWHSPFFGTELIFNL